MNLLRKFNLLSIIFERSGIFVASLFAFGMVFDWYIRKFLTMNKDELLKMQAVAIKKMEELQEVRKKKMEELQEVRKQVVKSIYDFLMEHNGGITIICDEEKKSWVGIEATDNETFYVSFDHSEKVFAENELGVKDIFDLNNFIINYYKEN